ncbi:MAG: hypothetical protein OEY97_08720 [Nitrospirota bacterium]|nr:hypothetical protein [Nitrospirota bacterium]
MAASALLVFAVSGAIFLWGVVLGVKACNTEHPPFMKGEGSQRFDSRMKKAA